MAVEANERLGFAADAREYAAAAAIFAALGIERVRLLTNNPAKVLQLEQHGIEVSERLPHRVDANPHNQGYLQTKMLRLGHLA